MPEDMVPPQDDPVGGAFMVIDQEIDKLVASLMAISDALDKVPGEPAAKKIREIVDGALSPYVAEVAQVMNNLEE